MFTILILKKRDEATTIKIILIFTSCNSFVGVGPFLNCTKHCFTRSNEKYRGGHLKFG